MEIGDSWRAGTGLFLSKQSSPHQTLRISIPLSTQTTPPEEENPCTSLRRRLSTELATTEVNHPGCWFAEISSISGMISLFLFTVSVRVLD
ncbi:hypothetical protein I3842_12G096800 [Carya illinoinensis]|uniref:Uncharacterized protein n=1 Tax=Carya illinoinensis TaxID=32201 RepID=A0A922IW13_CARIL|nr:hypothetical protein I3842_12G096800 [Carya illinoinensis]